MSKSQMGLLRNSPRRKEFYADFQKRKISNRAAAFSGITDFCCLYGISHYQAFLHELFRWNFGSISGQDFIGLNNYKDVLGDQYFRVAFVNTLVYTLVTVPGQMILGFLTAFFINQVTRFRVGYRVLYYLPVITSWVIASGV